ncbi:MAG: hypothetical protein AAGK66_09490 [Pseudomonadota bacterium]
MTYQPSDHFDRIAGETEHSELVDVPATQERLTVTTTTTTPETEAETIARQSGFALRSVEEDLAAIDAEHEAALVDSEHAKERFLRERAELEERRFQDFEQFHNFTSSQAQMLGMQLGDLTRVMQKAPNSVFRADDMSAMGVDANDDAAAHYRYLAAQAVYFLETLWDAAGYNLLLPRMNAGPYLHRPLKPSEIRSVCALLPKPEPAETH